jgi:hypothetical protein
MWLHIYMGVGNIHTQPAAWEKIIFHTTVGNITINLKAAYGLISLLTNYLTKN